MGNMKFYYATLVGVVIMVLMVLISEYHTSIKYRPVNSIAASSETGASTNIISGLSVGFESTLLPTVVIVVGILASYFIVGGTANPGIGLYGIAIAAVAMLSTTCMIVCAEFLQPNYRQCRRNRSDGKASSRGQENYGHP